MSDYLLGALIGFFLGLILFFGLLFIFLESI